MRLQSRPAKIRTLTIKQIRHPLNNSQSVGLVDLCLLPGPHDLLPVWLFSLKRKKLAADFFKTAPVLTKIRIPKSRSGADVDDRIRPVQQKFAIIDKQHRPQFNPQVVGRIIHNGGIAPA